MGAVVIDVRPADPGDSLAVQELLGQLGYTFAVEEVRARLDLLAKQPADPVLLAIEGDTGVGLIALHWTFMLHHGKPVARITALVVRDDVRGKGIGRTLVDAGAALARQAGCDMLELTTALHRTDAQAFYKALGFAASSLQLRRALER